MARLKAWRRFAGQRSARKVNLPSLDQVSRLFYILGSVFCSSGFFDLHVAELFRVKDLATLQALDKLGVFVPGNDTYLWVLADGCHRFGISCLKALSASSESVA